MRTFCMQRVRMNYPKTLRWPCVVGSARTRSFKAQSSPEDIPEWYKNLTELAQDDDELAELLLASRGDPSRLEKQLRAEMDQLHSRIVGTDGLTAGSGEDTPPTVSFQTADPFEQVIGIEMYEPAAGSTTEMLQEVVNSWFMLGKLGGFDAGNLQIAYSDGPLEYEEPDNSLPSAMHEMSPMEFKGLWGRFFVDMGTCDELAYDVLVNALRTFSKEHVGIRTIQIGGEIEDWPRPD